MRTRLRVCAAALLLPLVACSATDAEPSVPPAGNPGAAVAPGSVTEEPAEQAPSTPTLPEGEEALTFKNSRDLAILLEGPSAGPSVGRFASRNAGTAIEFDAHVVAVTASTVQLAHGDHAGDRRTGPTFELGGVVPTELGLEGELTEDDDVRVVARVGPYEPETRVLLLDPVSITRRG